jgi:hypothetical protein
MSKPVRNWRVIECAPYNEPVEVEAGRMRFPAILLPDAAMTTEEKSCDQWHATTDVYPLCWTDGACWETNADEQASIQPTRWRPIEAPVQQEPHP